MYTSKVTGFNFTKVKEFPYWIVFSANYNKFYLSTCSITIDITLVFLPDIPEQIRNHIEDPLFEIQCIKMWSNRHQITYGGEESNWNDY